MIVVNECTKEIPCAWEGCETCGPSLTSVGRDRLIAMVRALLRECRRLSAPPVVQVRRRASVVLVENTEGEVLVVWNRRFGGWTLPGGKQEPNESMVETARRELDEECNLLYSAGDFQQVYEGINKTQAEDMLVTVFRVTEAPDGRCPYDIRQTEDGCPVGWLSREDVLRWSPFADFYRRARMFETPRKTDSKSPESLETGEVPF